MDQSLRNPATGGSIDREATRERMSHHCHHRGSLIKRAGHANYWLWIVGCFLAGLGITARGQEAVRMSMAGEAAAEAQRRADSTLGYYNLKLGPTAWNFASGLGIQYNSNVNNTEGNPEGDMIFSPQINTRMHWPVSEMNSINLVLGAGYSAYINNQQLDRLFLTPGTGLSFDAYAGDFRINLHDRVTMSQNSYQDATVTGTGNYSQLQNALGTTVLWDLNKVIINFGYDHQNYVTFPSNTGQPNGVFEVASLSAGYMIKPQMLAGLEVGGNLINYPANNNTANINTTYNGTYGNARQWNVGGFYNTQVSDYIRFTGHAGYTVYTPQSSSETAVSGDFTGMYFSLDLNHRINQYVNYNLSIGRMVNAAFYGGPTEQYYARLGAIWQILEKISLSTTLSYEQGTQFSGSMQPYSRYGFGVGVGRSITKKLTASLDTQFYIRQSDSDASNQNYNLYTITLNLNYQF